LVWQLEKMQADEEARMIQVDRGEAWLAEILSPEPWDNHQSYGVTGLKEMVDPELARLRYLLWRREMASHLAGQWAPLLLGRTAAGDIRVAEGLAGMGLHRWRRAPAWSPREEDGGGGGSAGLPGREFAHLTPAWKRRAISKPYRAGPRTCRNPEQTALPAWPEGQRYFDLEICVLEAEEEEEEDWGPVLCWAGAGADICRGEGALAKAPRRKGANQVWISPSPSWRR
jgi:hypothetical protein